MLVILPIVVLITFKWKLFYTIIRIYKMEFLQNNEAERTFFRLRQYHFVKIKLFRNYNFSPPSIPPSSFLLPVTAAKIIFAMANTLLSFVS